MCSRMFLGGMKEVQSAEVTGSRPILEHWYSATAIESSWRPKYNSLGMRVSTPSSFLNSLNVSCMVAMALAGVKRAMPVVMILNSWMEVPDMYNMNAVVRRDFPGDQAIAIICLCFAAVCASIVTTLELTSVS